MAEELMLCRQCEQTAGGIGCKVRGVCGKDDSTAVSQDALIYALQGVAVYAERAHELGAKDAAVDTCVVEGLFTTVTNVNFDAANVAKLVRNAVQIREKAKRLFTDAYQKKNGKAYTGALPAVVSWQPSANDAELVKQGRDLHFIANAKVDPDIQSLREILLYGLKGMAAYADHAQVLGYSSETVNAFFHKGLAAMVDDTLSVEQLVGLNMEFGKVNLECLALLDKANTGTYGDPVPTKVTLGVKKGPAIIVSGHDLKDLHDLLEQTKGAGVNIYTHGEMLPCHAYPALKKYPHLAGHFGTAWQNQQKEFDGIPAVVLMTTNCIQKPKDSYLKNIFTTGLVQFPGVVHISTDPFGKKDFSPVIKRAKELGGFAQDAIGKEITIGFAHKTVLSVAPQVIDAVKKGAIKHFFLIGGCDGAKPGRNYYTELAEKVPQDCVILTLACGKFRFNALELGAIGGIPRLLDCGQCNDAYSAIVIASELAKAFNCGVNDLPLSLILSWYEQKAVCILLTLLSLGIKNIKIGPSLPAFITPNVLNVLVKNFNIAPISTPEADIAAALKKTA